MGSKVEIFNLLCIYAPILANSADPDEMLPYVAFHLGLHCLTIFKYLFASIQNEKG